MNNSVLLLDKNNFQKSIDVLNNENKNLYIIDLLDNDVEVDIKINIHASANMDIIISSLNYKNNVKKFKILVNHLDNSSTSYVNVYGINNDSSKTSFDLQAVIKDDSVDNFCQQSIKGVLLSDDAVIEGKPNLIINTNNIKAKHAVAIGCVNPAHIFYLESKGIVKEMAIKMILISYFNVILHKINDEEIREKYTQLIYEKIG